MTEKKLMVPVHVDALYLPTAEAVAESTADFRGLPYYDSEENRDVNRDTPWLGDSVISPPFENSNMMLQAGVHLHWSLPDGLCHGEVVDGEVEMPAVPNRWLIQRRKIDGFDEKSWVVESDYLWPSDNLAPAVNIFHQTSGEGRPYRFLGRKLPLEEWVNNNVNHEYLDKLTAIGYGEVTFAAYYPNCMTVFGFHDRELPDSWAILQYDIIGWYGNDSSPPLLSWTLDGPDSSDILTEPIRGWRVEGAGAEGPQQLMCYASIQLSKEGNSETSPNPNTAFKVAIGNTPSEALSALLAREVAKKDLSDPELAKKIEEQLELLLVEDQLTSEVQDLGLRLRRYRHQKSFDPVPGSERWSIHREPPGANSLPAEVVEALRHLNELQVRYGEQLSQLRQARRQLYGDWCNYMRCVYRPPNGGRGQFLDIDEVVTYIETRSLAEVERLAGIVDGLGKQVKKARAILNGLLLRLNIKALRLNMEQIAAYIVAVESLANSSENAVAKRDAEVKHDRAMARLDSLILRLNIDGIVAYIARVGQLANPIEKPAEKLEAAKNRLDSLLAPLNIDETIVYIESLGLQEVQQLPWWNEKDEAKKLQSAKVTLKGYYCNLFNRKLNNENDFTASPFLYTRDAVLREARRAKQNQQTEPVNTLETPSPPAQYTLKTTPGARFWQPTDPVVLVASDNIQLNNRHGQDGRHSEDGLLQCQICSTTKETADQVFCDARAPNPILQWIQEQWNPDVDSSSETSIGFRQVRVNETQHSAQPLFLDWGIDMYPAETHAPGTPGDYDRNIITGNYQLGSQNPDLQLGASWHVNDDPDRLSGRCILGDTPSLVLKERIENFLERRLVHGKPELWANAEDTDYFARIQAWYGSERDNLPTELAKIKTTTELQTLANWYNKRPLKSKEQNISILGEAQSKIKAQDPIYSTLLAYQKLFDNADSETDETLHPRAFLAQSLSGFNEEMIQWKLGLSLPIDEPIGFTPYREFTQRVAEAIADETTWMTEPTNNFSPIRSGVLTLDKLRLINDFGQVTDIPSDDEVIVPTPYQAPGRKGEALLPPRLVQPARVTFRWLDVDLAPPVKSGTQATTSQASAEMVEEQAKSPICGWLVPEKLRRRLLVFDGEGNPLGSIAADKKNNNLEWAPAPGLPLQTSDVSLQEVSNTYYKLAAYNQDAIKDMAQMGASIPNSRLAKVLLYLIATRSKNFLDGFLNTLDNAMANIDPEGTTSMGSLALLVGRPVAVVGAELDLTLKDAPAVRQDWSAFLLDQYRQERDTDKFENVQFRLRLGQYQSRNDGVVGYWLEESDKFAKDTFIAQAADDNDPGLRLEVDANDDVEGGLKARINAHDAFDQIDDLNFTQSVADPPLQVTLLMDPRGKAHLTTGILPVKSIDIPRQLWEPALERLKVWFPVAPILTRSGSRRVPTPTMVDRQWNWLEKIKVDNGSSDWRTLHPQPSVDRQALRTALLNLNARLGRVSLADYDLILRGPESAHKVPTRGNSLVIAQKAKENDQYYLVHIFDGIGNQITTAEKLTEPRSVIEELDKNLPESELLDHRGRYLVKKIVAEVAYQGYVLVGGDDSLQGNSTGRVAAQKIEPEEDPEKYNPEHYLIDILNKNQERIITGWKLTDSGLIKRLDEYFKASHDSADGSNSNSIEIAQEVIIKALGYEQYNFILRESKSTFSLPSIGKNLVIGIKSNDNYEIQMLDGSGQQVEVDQILSNIDLIGDLNYLKTLRGLGHSITSHLGYDQFEIDQLISKGWLQEINPLGNRLFVTPKEDRQPLNDWAIEEPLDTLLTELSLTLTSPGEEADFSPSVEVRGGWLMLSSGETAQKT